ncbi:unnamed protein product [Dibothriocephalus latus]|uniref:Uncharacterized protein n=1 Tax=Dibothriocephalus latus TaxID=60516 RepID=A0A3P7P1P6_DIBLA|nr:unnamed protein product [Dibothriocephalus latus]
MDLELQQRAVEYTAVFNKHAEPFRAGVFACMPVFEPSSTFLTEGAADVAEATEGVTNGEEGQKASYGSARLAGRQSDLRGCFTAGRSIRFSYLGYCPGLFRSVLPSLQLSLAFISAYYLLIFPLPYSSCFSN